MDGIVHFGMPKTGSSSIQKTLYKLRNNSNADFAFFSLDGDFSGNRVVRVLAHTEWRKQGRNIRIDDKLTDVDAEKARIYGELEKQIKAGAGKSVIFSSEIASGIPEEELVVLREKLVAAGLSPRAISYIRPPKSYMESVFQQRIKGGVGEFSMNPLFPKYRKAYERFDVVFGAERVEFWLFDPAQFLNGCVVQDFAKHAGISVPADQVRRANDSLPLPALKLLYTYRKFGEEYGDNIYTVGNRLLLGKLREVKGPKLRLHSSLITPLLKKFHDDVEWVEKRLGATFTEDLTADDATAVRSEEDMLSYSADSLQWLSKQIAPHPLAKAVLAGDPETVAKGMHALYNTLLGDKPDMSRTQAKQSRRQAGNRKSPKAAKTDAPTQTFDMRSLVEAALQDDSATKNLKPRRARMLLSSFLGKSQRTISDTQSGATLSIEALGEFSEMHSGEEGKEWAFILQPAIEAKKTAAAKPAKKK